MENKESQHCWEFQNCHEEIRNKCPAYLYPDEKCWHIASHYNGEGCPKAKGKGVGYCFTECAWYKKNNPDVIK